MLLVCPSDFSILHIHIYKAINFLHSFIRSTFRLNITQYCIQNILPVFSSGISPTVRRSHLPSECFLSPTSPKIPDIYGRGIKVNFPKKDKSPSRIVERCKSKRLIISELRVWRIINSRRMVPEAGLSKKKKKKIRSQRVQPAREKENLQMQCTVHALQSTEWRIIYDNLSFELRNNARGHTLK